MKPRLAVLVGIVLVAALARLLPHPPNFTPIGAVALFGAAHFKQQWAAFVVPLLAMPATRRCSLAASPWRSSATQCCARRQRSQVTCCPEVRERAAHQLERFSPV